MNRTVRRLCAVLLTVPLVACDTARESQGTADAPIDKTEKGGWIVFAAPDGFPNVAFRCHGTTGLYAPRQDDDSTRHIVAVPNDPECNN